MSDYLDTITTLSRASQVSFTTIVKYAKAGFLDYVLSTDGRMLFRTGQVEKVKELRASNVKRRVETARAARHPNSRGSS